MTFRSLQNPILIPPREDGSPFIGPRDTVTTLTLPAPQSHEAFFSSIEKSKGKEVVRGDVNLPTSKEKPLFLTSANHSLRGADQFPTSYYNDVVARVLNAL